MKLYEETLKRTVKHTGRLVDVFDDEVLIHGNNQTSYREVVSHPGGVCVAAKTKNNTYLLARQYRYAQGSVGLEFIAGKLEIGEDPFLSIQRELSEEAGVKAKEWKDLGTTFPSPAYLNEKIHLYLAWDLEETKQDLDEDEFIIVEEYTIKEIIELIENEEIVDLKTIALAYRIAYEELK